jgi:hypothetical protein
MLAQLIGDYGVVRRGRRMEKRVRRNALKVMIFPMMTTSRTKNQDKFVDLRRGI